MGCKITKADRTAKRQPPTPVTSFIPMPSEQHRNLQHDDKVFLNWLRSVSGHTQPRGTCSVLQAYVVGRKDGTWAEVVSAMGRERHEWWPFLRGTLSCKEISRCRDRYLDRFVFIAKDAPAEEYIASLMDVEQAQIAHKRGDQGTAIVCSACAQKDTVIQGLRDQIQNLTRDAEPVGDDTGAKLEYLKIYFHDTYVKGCGGSMSRHALRMDLEDALQCRFGKECTMTSRSDLWNIFIRDVIRDARNEYRPLRIKRRTTVGAKRHKSSA